MHRSTPLALASCLLLTLSACSGGMDTQKPAGTTGTHTTAPERPEPILAGGYSSRDPNDQGVLQALRFIEKERLARNSKAAGVQKVLKAESQVVAGTNYRLTLQLTDGNQYQAVVYQNLQGEMKLTDYRLIR